MNAPLWTKAELETVFGAADAPAAGVSIDTRTLQPGDLFFAIQGDASDGHAYLARAFAAGASAAVVSREKASALSAAGPLIVVEDTLRALERLGVAARARTEAKIAAVTGSVGKSSAKDMLRVVLSRAGATHAAIASYNNHWGVPLTLARMPASSRYAVFEIGMNHAGEITPLVAMVRPSVALVTMIAPAHIEYLGSLEAIAAAKAEIFSGLPPGGDAVLNRDAPHFDLLERRAEAAGAQITTFGAHRDSDARLVGFEADGGGVNVEARFDGRTIVFKLGAPGAHMAQNALGVLVVARALGLDLEESAKALSEFSPPKGRGERVVLSAPDGALTLIDESYNANPTSMRAALDLLGASAPASGGRRIAALGDMLELGADSAAMHVGLAEHLQRNNVDLLFCAGPMMRGLYEAAPAAMRALWRPNAADIQSTLVATLRAGDVIMVKGSNGSRMGPIVAALKEKFSGDASAA
jgi:UDP-N-acetylmuramoyl-tripeptide--D-alanyl-D-alanine ligase